MHKYCWDNQVGKALKEKGKTLWTWVRTCIHLNMFTLHTMSWYQLEWKSWLLNERKQYRHFLKKRSHNIISQRVQQTLKDLSIYIKPLYSEMSQGKPFGCSSCQAQHRVKHFKFYSEAKLFLKFSWQPASLVIHRFDVCFKNLAQTDKLWARNPNKQSEKPRTILGKWSLYHHCGPSM